MALLKVTFAAHCYATDAFQASLSADEVAAFNASTGTWPPGVHAVVSARIVEDPVQTGVFEVNHRFEAVLLVDHQVHPKPFEMPSPNSILDDAFDCIMAEGGLPSCSLEDSDHEVVEYEPA